MLYNNQLLHEEELRLPITNRAFQYNDGFFETMIVQDGKIRFWQDHLGRMAKATHALKLQLSSGLENFEALEEQLLQLATQNNCQNYGRLKLKVWRGGAGLFTPETNTTEWLATVQPATAPKHEPIHIGVAHSVHTSFSPFSHFKGPNSLLYVLAGTEKKETKYDDLLLLNDRKEASELISANLFWFKQGILYTPALDTGCVNGIVRRNILRWCKSEGISVKETYAEPPEIINAEAVFAGNIAGLRQVSKLQDAEMTTDATIVTTIREVLKLK
nr:aminotransferase class IV [Pontibacter harenae]